MEIMSERQKKYSSGDLFRDLFVLAAMAAFSFWIDRTLVAGIVG